MKKISTLLLILSLATIFLPFNHASAAAKAGIKPGSFFYFFDTTFEKINLFFTFNPEKKAQKNLEYADERLAEAEAVAEEKNTDAVKTAVAGYESNMASAAEESKQIKDKNKTEELLNSISDNTSKHQEVLADVLNKVPDEAKEAIIKAIEASKKGQEEAIKQIAELKSEVEQLKKEMAELKEKQDTVQPALKQSAPTTQNLQEQNKLEEKSKTITLPNGSVAEVDSYGKIIRYIKEVIYVSPPQSNIPTTQNSLSESENNSEKTIEGFIAASCNGCTNNNIPQNIQTNIGSFILENKTDDDIALSNLAFRINSEFAKNLSSSIEIYAQFPANIWGWGESAINLVGALNFDQACITTSIGSGNYKNECDESKLQIFDNLSFNLSTQTIPEIEKNKQIKIFVRSRIRVSATEGEYKAPLILKSCVGYGIKTKQEAKCSPENILGGDLKIMK